MSVKFHGQSKVLVAVSSILTGTFEELVGDHKTGEFLYLPRPFHGHAR